MGEIKKSFFKKLDRNAEQKATAPIIENEEACRQVAIVYSQYVNKWSGRQAFFLTPRMSTEKREKRLSQIRRLIRIVADLGVPVEIYIKAQFEQQMVWLKKKGLNYVPFANLISQRAVEEFERYKSRIDKSHSADVAKKEFYSTQALNVRQSVHDSVTKFYYRLMAVKKIKGEMVVETALAELETMVRAGMITNIYLYVSPLANFFTESSQYLNDKWTEVDKKLSSFDKKTAVKTRKEIIENFADEEVKSCV